LNGWLVADLGYTASYYWETAPSPMAFAPLTHQRIPLWQRLDAL
jgi:hypothetical protein